MDLCKGCFGAANNDCQICERVSDMNNNFRENSSGYYDKTAYYAMKNAMNEEHKKIDVFRGDVFYVKNFKGTGSEQSGERPAVIVSNDIGNKHSGICEVVYLTTKKKKPLPTHVSIMCRVPSVALCEQVCTVSQERLGEFVRTCTDEEMKKIDKALAISLNLFGFN